MTKNADEKPDSDQTRDNAYTIRDPELFAQNMLRLVEEGGKVFAGMLSRGNSEGGAYSTTAEVMEATETLTEVAREWMNTPGTLAEIQGDLMRGYVDLWNNSMKRALGEASDPVVEPEPSDKRFNDQDWKSNPYFDFWKQAYLLTCRWADEALEKTDGLDRETRKRAEFYLRQVESAASPSNFILTNPEVMRETLRTNGDNLVRGMHQLAEDLNRSGDLLKISQTDLDAFKVGENLAVTPGKVVFQNDIIQLIQYTPTTKSTYKVPLLIVPPWINKFYILDLTAEKSFIRYAVSKGITVFVVSWVNPDAKLASKTFEDYMHEGVLVAADTVRRATQEPKLNIIGYCVGGTLVSATLAYLAATRQDIINSATLFTTQVDFSHAGDLLIFTEDGQLAALEQMMTERGYLDGSRMANVFNMLRPRDLIWPYIVNNYMLGKKPMPFDLLYWNQDSTRLPAANHKFYLRAFYHDNLLARGEMKMSGITLDMKKVRVPIYNLAAREDHIAPARSVHEGCKLFGGPVRLVISGSGHIAGVINPPEKKKYQYWTNDADAQTLENWFEGAEEHPGSWWPDWLEWISARSGKKVPARDPEKGPLEPIEDAPGSYVRMRG